MGPEGPGGQVARWPEGPGRLLERRAYGSKFSNQWLACLTNRVFGLMHNAQDLE